jgi:hypothetical protein
MVGDKFLLPNQLTWAVINEAMGSRSAPRVEEVASGDEDEPAG